MQATPKFRCITQLGTDPGHSAWYGSGSVSSLRATWGRTFNNRCPYVIMTPPTGSLWHEASASGVRGRVRSNQCRLARQLRLTMLERQRQFRWKVRISSGLIISNSSTVSPLEIAQSQERPGIEEERESRVQCRFEDSFHHSR
eukprot:3531554-Rhodomonas_salina.2